MPQPTQVSKMNVGDKVQGVYHGAVFTGTIKSTRQHSKNHKITEVSIAYDVPITVYGDTRTSGIFDAYEDGKHWSDPNGFIQMYVEAPKPEPKPFFHTPAISVQWDQAEYNRYASKGVYGDQIVFHTKASKKAKEQAAAMVMNARFLQKVTGANEKIATKQNQIKRATWQLDSAKIAFEDATTNEQRDHAKNRIDHICGVINALESEIKDIQEAVKAYHKANSK